MTDAKQWKTHRACVKWLCLDFRCSSLALREDIGSRVEGNTLFKTIQRNNASAHDRVFNGCEMKADITRRPLIFVSFLHYLRYYPLNKMTDAEQEQLIADHFLFDKPVSPLLTSAGMARDWPDARGIWHNEDKNFLVWINEEDHTRVISMQKGGDMAAVFKRFCTGLHKVCNNSFFILLLWRWSQNVQWRGLKLLGVETSLTNIRFQDFTPSSVTALVR